VIVTGERVITPAAGFNPTWQRHVAAYARCEPLLGPGPVLDLGCGIGHSYALLAPRRTVGVDIDADVLAGQGRETVQADMRALPFPDASFGSVLAVQSIEHVPDPERVIAEAARVLDRDGVAVFVTPNRLRFARPDEIIDPYHYVEYDPDQLHALCAASFAAVEVRGLFGSPRYLEFVAREHGQLDRLLRLDPLRLRRAVPRAARQALYDLMLSRARRKPDELAGEITVEDFELRADAAATAFDLVAICATPRS
jgi:SAM-dependent methyltransferase